jgi:hypothetical protein
MWIWFQMFCVWDVISSFVISNNFWWFEISKYNVFCLLCNCFICTWFLWFDLYLVFWAWIWSQLHVTLYFSIFFVWMVSIMLGWYYVVWFMCVDTKSCKHQHRSAQQMISCKIPFIVISLVSSSFVYDFYKCTY